MSNHNHHHRLQCTPGWERLLVARVLNDWKYENHISLAELHLLHGEGEDLERFVRRAINTHHGIALGLATERGGARVADLPKILMREYISNNGVSFMDYICLHGDLPSMYHYLCQEIYLDGFLARELNRQH